MITPKQTIHFQMQILALTQTSINYSYGILMLKMCTICRLLHFMHCLLDFNNMAAVLRIFVCMHSYVLNVSKYELIVISYEAFEYYFFYFENKQK